MVYSLLFEGVLFWDDMSSRNENFKFIWGQIRNVLDGGYWYFIQILKRWKKTVPDLALMQIKSYNKNSLVLAFVIHSTGSFNLINNSNKKINWPTSL